MSLAELLAAHAAFSASLENDGYGQAYAPQVADRHYLGSAEILGQDVEVLGNDGLELLGNDAEALAELLGEDGLELLGAARARRPMRFQPKHRIAVRKPVLDRELPIPIPAVVLTDAVPTAILNVQAQETCQINKLIIPSNLGNQVLINDVIIATRSQFLAPGSLSGVFFSEVQTGRLKGDTSTRGTIISLSVTKTVAGDLTFVGAGFLALAVVS